MATVQILEDGPRNVVIKLEDVVTAADDPYTIFVDPATLSPIDSFGNPATKLRLDHILFNVEDSLSVNLFWDATTPLRIEELTGRGTVDYAWFGGLNNNAGAGVTGKIGFSTQGWTTGATLSFVVILKLVK